MPTKKRSILGSTGDAMRDRPHLFLGGGEKGKATEKNGLQPFFREIAAAGGREETAVSGPFTEIELPDEYEVSKIMRDSKRGNPLVAAIVIKVNESDKEIKILLLDRPDLIGIAKGHQLFLTEYRFGECKVYRETLPR